MQDTENVVSRRGEALAMSMGRRELYTHTHTHTRSRGTTKAGRPHQSWQTQRARAKRPRKTKSQIQDAEASQGSYSKRGIRSKAEKEKNAEPDEKLFVKRKQQPKQIKMLQVGRGSVI